MDLKRLFDLNGRTALVTGGGRGLGRDIALGLAEAGADIVVASRKRPSCEAVAAEVRALGRQGVAFEADLSDLDAIERLVGDALAAVGRIDILVNNAAFGWGAPFLDHPPEGFDRVFDLNVRGLFFASQHLARHMLQMGGGVILHISSIAAFRGAPDDEEASIAYTASKGAVNTLTRDMAVKLAPHGIRVNAIAPGPFDTDMMDHIKRDPERLERFLAKIPQHRIGNADDIKGAAVFLASDAARYITGHILVADGGWSIRTS